MDVEVRIPKWKVTLEFKVHGAIHAPLHQAFLSKNGYDGMWPQAMITGESADLMEKFIPQFHTPDPAHLCCLDFTCHCLLHIQTYSRKGPPLLRG
jgi:hypothetical protein